MFGDVWAWAGEFRTCSLHLGVEPQHIETSLYQMLDNVAFREKSGMDIVEQAVLLHHEAARVHPFMNGNGRWARLLADIWLRLHRAPVVDWPADFAGTVSPTRADYIEAMKAADQGDLAPLTELHRRYTAK
jgi:fido (protein-threonine AMPylation protein)